MTTTHFDQLQLAERWGLSPKTLERWRVIGTGPKYIPAINSPKSISASKSLDKVFAVVTNRKVAFCPICLSSDTLD